jgi:hypothetical protein
MRLRRDLDAITLCWSLLSDITEPIRGGDGGRGKRPDPPAPANLDVLDVTDPRSSQVIAAMGWARITVEDLRLSTMPSDVAECATLLIRHLDWVAAQPWADEALDEISQAARTLRWMCGDVPEASLGRCPDIDPRGEADRCGGPLRWADGTLTVVCGRCGGMWRTDDLVNLGRVSPMQVWATIPNVAVMLDVPERTIRSWVQAGKFRRNSLGQVRHADVWHTMMERRNDPQQRLTAEGRSTT